MCNTTKRLTKRHCADCGKNISRRSLSNRLVDRQIFYCKSCRTKNNFRIKNFNFWNRYYNEKYNVKEV